jgi:RNA polymerase sigma-70 factor, ECF subfamily
VSSDAEDRRRFEEAMLPHLDAAYNLARWLTRDEHAAQDVVQDTYHRALRFFHGFRGQDARAWLLAIVRNAAYDWLRKQRVWKDATQYDDELHGQGDESTEPQQLALQQANRQMVMQAVESLSVEFREVTVLRELEGLSYQQIAMVTGSPVGTVMSRLSRARIQLRKLLMQALGEGTAN